MLSAVKTEAGLYAASIRNDPTTIIAMIRAGRTSPAHRLTRPDRVRALATAAPATDPPGDMVRGPPGTRCTGSSPAASGHAA